MGSCKKIISVLKTNWFDCILLFLLCIAFFLIAHSYLIVAGELNTTDPLEKERADITLVDGTNFHNGVPADDSE